MIFKIAPNGTVFHKEIPVAGSYEEYLSSLAPLAADIIRTTTEYMKNDSMARNWYWHTFAETAGIAKAVEKISWNHEYNVIHESLVRYCGIAKLKIQYRMDVNKFFIQSTIKGGFTTDSKISRNSMCMREGLNDYAERIIRPLLFYKKGA